MPSDEAWRMFDRWKAGAKQVGVIFYGKSGTFCTMGVIASAHNGRLQFSAETAGASFDLKSAEFLYGPVQMFPRWPLPPPVEVNAIQAYLKTGDWLVLAEGITPDALPIRQLADET